MFRGLDLAVRIRRASGLSFILPAWQAVCLQNRSHDHLPLLCLQSFYMVKTQNNLSPKASKEASTYPKLVTRGCNH